MISITDLKEKIPEEALSLLSKTFQPPLYNKILLAIRSPRSSTFRLNRIKIDKKKTREIIESIKALGFKVKPVDFIRDSYMSYLFFLD